MEMLSGAEMVVQSLVDQGVKQVFGYPGGAVLDIYDALHTLGGIDHVLVRHEQAAVHMADGLARATGEVGVVLVTSGPGATNAITGIAYLMKKSETSLTKKMYIEKIIQASNNMLSIINDILDYSEAAVHKKGQWERNLPTDLFYVLQLLLFGYFEGYYRLGGDDPEGEGLGDEEGDIGVGVRLVADGEVLSDDQFTVSFLH